jgi:uncharacterized protein YraI
MVRTLMLAAGMAALLAPLLTVPAAAQNANQRGNRAATAMAGRDTMLRAGPQSGYPQLRRIDQGQQVQLFGCLADRSWCEVGSGPDRGWASAPDLQVEVRGRRDSVANLYGEFGLGDRDFRIGDYWDENYRNQPFYGERGRWEDHYAQNYQPSWGQRQNGSRWGNRPAAAAAVMLRQATLRAGPNINYPRVGIARARARVSVFGCLRDRSWCDIGVRNNRGWVSGRHVGSLYRGRLQSLYAIAPAMGIGVLSFSFGRYWDDNYRSQPFYAERDRWERQYRQDYRPSWGAGPDRDDNQRDRDGRDRNWQSRPQALMLPIDSQATHGSEQPSRLDQR